MKTDRIYDGNEYLEMLYNLAKADDMGEAHIDQFPGLYPKVVIEIINGCPGYLINGLEVSRSAAAELLDYVAEHMGTQQQADTSGV